MTPAHCGIRRITALVASKQQEVIGASDLYLRSGRLIGRWKAAISEAMHAGQFDVDRVAHRRVGEL
jgi:hypothetical protein